MNKKVIFLKFKRDIDEKIWFVENELVIINRDHPFSTYAEVSEKLLFHTPWYAHVRVHMCARQSVWNVNFSENFV